MSKCRYDDMCGGCVYRNLDLSEYRKQKILTLKNILQPLSRQKFVFEEPIFVDDGCRRRANMTFCKQKNTICLGFNARHSSQIANIENCVMLTKEINSALPFVRSLLEDICSIKFLLPSKKKKISYGNVLSGDIWITQAENGLDLLLEFSYPINLEMRELLFEKIYQQENVIRISHRQNVNDEPETIIEKAKPFITIGDCQVFVPAGTFLQPSKQGEQALVNLVNKYLGDCTGKIADLFCGVGTFSYSLAQKKGVKILASDTNVELLKSFQLSLNKNMITNVEIVNRNLFKYPLSGTELNGLSAIVFDPPRAGAKEQVKAIVDLPSDEKPQRIVAVSCNPSTFVRDAQILILGGYMLKKLTMVDQFVYSEHCELVALFEKI
ncbi:MAG: class I SAM-dependent RNA methyltransferase [Alphaproteobacteria bacterium]|nr:class I SAM-dependent RNA methyltransferase [Alphaproteobacteria bacterium]